MMELRKFDPIDFLDSDEALVEYLNVALEENDPKYFAKALGNVARAKGMTSVSEATGLGGKRSIVRFPAKVIRGSTRCSRFSTCWICGLP